MKKQVLFMSAFLAVNFLCGCVETALVYNPNLHQTGRTTGKGIYRARVSAALVPEIHTAPDNTALVTLTDPSNKNSLSISAEACYGISNRVDIGGEQVLGFYDRNLDQGSTGTRAFTKIMFTKTGKKIALSFMPTIVYISDKDRDEDNHESLKSWMYGTELNLPMSYSLNKRTELTWCPKLALLRYKASYHHNDPNGNLPKSQNDIVKIAAPGFSLGFRYGLFHLEGTILSLKDETPSWSAGLAVIK